MKTFQSTPITFIDQTDSRKLEVYIKSNLPTVQIYNQNKSASEAYTPDWTEGEKLVLSMDVFLDSRTMTTAEYNGTAIKWYKNDVEMTDGSIEDISDDKRKITIKDNILKDNAIITYTCEATYQDIVASSRITFTRVDTGLNGNDGTDGKGVTILGSYSSVETLLEAHPTGNEGDSYIVDGDLYVWAVDDAEWENVGNIQGPKGEDAKSIILIGSAQVFKINQTRTASTPTNITITPHTINISDEEKQGIRWEYRYNSNTQWLGLSEGEKFLNESTTLSDNIVTIDGSKLLNSNIISMSFKASVGYVEDVFTVYKVLDGVDGAKGDQGEDAPIAFLSNENISFVADEDGLTYGGGQSVLTNVVAYLGTTKVTPQISLALANSSLPEGMSIAIDEETMANIKSINPDFKEIILKISVRDGVNLGSALSNNGIIPITVSNPASVSLQLSWSKINTGHTGVGIDKVTVTYSKSTSTTPIPTDWKTTIAEVNVAEGEYLWTKTVTQYTSDSKPATTTYTYAKQGATGKKGDPGIPVTVTNIHYGKNLSSTTYPQNESDWYTAVVATKGGEYLWTRTTFSDGQKSYSVAQQGRGIDKITEYYLATTASSGVTTSTTGWTPAIQTIDASKRYLWNYETITYTDTTTSTTTPVIIGVFGSTGATGKGIRSIKEYYLASALSSGVTTSTTGWKDTMQTITATNKYLWNYELITYTDDSTEALLPVVIGVYGDKGDPGTSASLVDVTPSALYFKSSTGSAGPFEPQYIYLYPRFQNATYNNWQYATDGGISTTSWKSVSGVNGLSVARYNSVDNTLRIDRSSTLYTNTITSISFRCNSMNSAVYDTVSIAKIYDVADLQIGGRNYIKNGEQEFTKDTGVAQAEYLLLPYDLTPIYETYGLDQLYTLSFDLKSKDITNSSQISVYPEPADPPPSKYIFPYTVLTVTTDFKRYSITFKPTRSSNANATLSRIAVYGTYNTGNIPVIKNLKLELGNTPTDFTPAPEDLVEEAANVNVMLSNEAHFFEATAGGVPIDTSVTLDVVGYKGSVKSATTVGTISGIPSAGMTATVTNNGTMNTKLTIAITSALTSDIADYGILTIPITVNGHTINKIFNWTKAKAGDVGASGSDAITFQVYSNNGYALSTSVPTLTLQTFAYVGDVEIKAGATYQWYRHNNTDWVAVSGATNDYFNVSRDDVTFSNNYMCKMLFGGAEYVGVVTIDDKNDENKVFASKPYNYFAGDLWIVGTDYTPPSYTVGTMLRAEHTNTGYTDSDWVPATKYDDEIKDLRDTVDSYKQYFSVNSTNGLQIGNSSINNDILTIDTVNAANINSDSASLESLDIVGRYSGSTMLQAPVINLGKFSIVIESNGSLSIVANT